MYEWNVRLGINVIAGYTSKQGYHSFEKKGGGRKTILNNSPHESKAVNESFESSRIEWIFFRIYFFLSGFMLITLSGFKFLQESMHLCIYEL